MPPEPTRKPRERPKPYKPRVQHEKQTNMPKSSAQSSHAKRRSNLTLYDWTMIFKFMDDHKDMSQDAIVSHFKNKPTGALIFTQSTLSRKIASHAILEARVNEFPNALATKRARIVTRPDVDKALFYWVKQMEGKKETVNSAMLIEKRARFEVAFGVPEEERLPGEGWVQSFCRAYKIREIRRHGEAGSVDVAAVKDEQIRIAAILKEFEPHDRFNFDETALFAFAPPDRGLATKQMSGKKTEKFRITLGVGCNATGTEKLPLLFIGKSKQPRCFKHQSPQSLGFDYHNNANAWMTREIFEQWIKNLDLKMGLQNRHIILLVDNFSGHTISYIPHNIKIEFFKPNLTSFVQPCDAGIIRCLKAHYRHAFCLRALDLEEAEERDIYKIQLNEAMYLAKAAWNSVTQETIAHCWNHTNIQPNPSIQESEPEPLQNIAAWRILHKFAVSEISLPDIETKLKAHLGSRYRWEDWKPAINAVMHAEKDVDEALRNLDKLTTRIFNSPITGLLNDTTSGLLAPPSAIQMQQPVLPQLQEIENSLQDAVNTLKKRNKIVGKLPTMEEMLDPVEEREIGMSVYQFEGGDDEIVAKVKHEIAVENGEVAEVDSDNEEEKEEETLKLTDAIRYCASLEMMCMQFGPPEDALSIAKTLRQLRIHFRKLESKNSKQLTLDCWLEKNV